MSKPKSISDETKGLILEAAWDLITEVGRTDVAMTEVAARAGVSRQTVFYAFGGRPNLLLAMVRHKDTRTDHVARLRAVGAQPDPGPETLIDYSKAWLDYLPVIYPVGILLDAASINDPEAAAAWNDRMITALLGGYRRLTQSIHKRHPLPTNPDQLADTIWALVHPTTYRRLVEDCGWSGEAFRSHQLAIIRSLVGCPD
jgi:AcrR family transcriptional regulator